MDKITVPTPEQLKKQEALKQYFEKLGSVAVAFSSGVDSTYLLKVAHDVLGERAIAVTASSCSFPKRELKEAEAFCRKENIRHFITESEELEIEGFAQNPAVEYIEAPKRLYFAAYAGRQASCVAPAQSQ